MEAIIRYAYLKVRKKNRQTITTKLLTKFNKICLRLRAFVSVGEAFLFLFKASKVHQKSVKWIKNWFGCVLLDLKNPTQLTTLKTVEWSSRKWPAKFLSSMASLHKKMSLASQFYNISPLMNLFGISKTSNLYIF